MVPTNVLITVWVWLGRAFVNIDETGWNTLLFTFWGLPLLAIAFTVTTVLWRQAASQARTSSMPWTATLAQVLLWLSLAIFGATMTDVADPSTSGTTPHWSVLTMIVGWSQPALDLTERLADIAAASVAGTWLLLCVVLICQIRNQRTSIINRP